MGRVQRHEISHHAHAHHPLMAPLSDATVDRVLDRLLPAGGGRLLDLGCGRGEWIRRALTARATKPHVLSVGIACYPAHGLDTEGLRQRAVDALAAARHWRQDRIEIATADA